jgi:hypothetical protein
MGSFQLHGQYHVSMTTWFRRAGGRAAKMVSASVSLGLARFRSSSSSSQRLSTLSTKKNSSLISSGKDLRTFWSISPKASVVASSLDSFLPLSFAFHHRRGLVPRAKLTHRRWPMKSEPWKAVKNVTMYSCVSGLLWTYQEQNRQLP